MAGERSWGRPNVVVIMTDDQGYGDMSCHGNPYLRTPHIDELHNESVRLTDFHVDPTCSPTRAALMTGRYATRTGVWLTYMARHYLRSDEVTMADIFAGNGYRTAIFGKWHLGDNYPYRPEDRGFQVSLVHGGGVVGEVPDYWGNDYYDDTYLRNGRAEKVEGYCTDVWFREALDFINRDDDRPFFVFIPTNAPHGPHHVPSGFREPYMDKQGIPRDRSYFYGMIAGIDENLGRLRKELEEMGRLDNTILIFMTDNGTAGGYAVSVREGEDGISRIINSGYNAGMRNKKGSAYEGGHRAACFIRWPEGGIEGGRDIDRLCAHFDLLPTLINLCDLELPEKVDFDGIDLSSLLYGEAEEGFPERTLFVHHQGRFGQKVEDDGLIKYKDYAVMTEKWRRVCDELYNIQDDPAQKVDLADAYPSVMKVLGTAYEQWWEDVSAGSEEYTRTIIGSDHQPLTRLTCQGWHGEDVPYNQEHVRNGMIANGFWDLTVEKEGTYEIELRRWPREADCAIDGLATPMVMDPEKHDPNSRLIKLPDRIVKVVNARLKVGEFDESVEVRPGEKMVRFRVPLEPGGMNLQTWFTDTAGVERGAYYVYIERMN